MLIRASSMSKIMGYLIDYDSLKVELDKAESLLRDKLEAKDIEVNDEEVSEFLQKNYVSPSYPKGCKKEYDSYIKILDKINTPDELPEGAKNYAHTLFIEQKGLDLTMEGFMPHQIQKGNLMEDEAIELVNDLKLKDYAKNNLRAIYDLKSKTIVRYNPKAISAPEFKHAITGECDIYSEYENLVRDIKCPQDFRTYTNHKGISINYYWQLITYSFLWSAKNLSLDFCLMPTPFEVYSNFNDENKQKVRDFNSSLLEIPLDQRLKSFTIEEVEIDKSIKQMLKRVYMLAMYYNTLTLEKLIYE